MREACRPSVSRVQQRQHPPGTMCKSVHNCRPPKSLHKLGDRVENAPVLRDSIWHGSLGVVLVQYVGKCGANFKFLIPPHDGDPVILHPILLHSTSVVLVTTLPRQRHPYASSIGAFDVGVTAGVQGFHFFPNHCSVVEVRDLRRNLPPTKSPLDRWTLFVTMCSVLVHFRLPGLSAMLFSRFLMAQGKSDDRHCLASRRAISVLVLKVSGMSGSKHGTETDKVQKFVVAAAICRPIAQCNSVSQPLNRIPVKDRFFSARTQQIPSCGSNFLSALCRRHRQEGNAGLLALVLRSVPRTFVGTYDIELPFRWQYRSSVDGTPSGASRYSYFATRAFSTPRLANTAHPS